MGDALLAKLRRKVLYKDLKRQSAKVAIPRWWVGEVDYVELEVYPDRIVITRVEE